MVCLPTALALLALAGAASGFVLLPTTQPLPIPTPQQLAYQGGISGLIHFSMATFFHNGDPACTRDNWLTCDKKYPEGGCNSSNPASFAPTHLDVSTWVDSLLALGASSAVLTAKHGCGFLGWQSNATLPNDAPYEYRVPASMPVLPMFVEAMQKAGLGYGFYYSLPRNFFLNVADFKVQDPATLMPGQARVTQAQFEDLAYAHMVELWTTFGNLTEVWLDGGCGLLCDRVDRLLKQAQPNALVFNGCGVSQSPIRWCGSEAADGLYGWPTVWSSSRCDVPYQNSSLGLPPNATGAIFMPSGADNTLQVNDHWFWTPNTPVHNLTVLSDWYHKSAGSNGHMELDFAIDRTGRVDPAHAAAYAGLGNWIRSCYGSPLAAGQLVPGETTVLVPLAEGASAVDRVMLVEDQTQGQRIYSYAVEALLADSQEWVPFSQGVSIGAKRIDVAAAPVVVAAMRVRVLSGFAPPTGLELRVFAAASCALAPFWY